MTPLRLLVSSPACIATDKQPSNSGAPRYCPSLETKVHRFPERVHHLWLEPEGLDSDLIYPNGIAMSLPKETQQTVVNSIAGLEHAKIMSYGYAVEYDYVDPRELKLSLETKKIPGLFFAGQINGTTGYEEAGSQGLIAGANAAISATREGDDPLIVSRSEGYVGVLIDDLVTRGTNEPYRMFTSRAEFRLSLRQDNADMRLTKKGYDIGLVSQKRYDALLQKQASIEKYSEKLKGIEMRSKEWMGVLDDVAIHQASSANYVYSAWNLLGRHDLPIERFEALYPELRDYPDSVKRYITSERRYAPQIVKQVKQIEMLKRDEHLLLPEETDYSTLGYLSNEERQKLARHRPQTLGQASRISGMTPSSLYMLHKICVSRTRSSPPSHLLEDNDIEAEM
eukprot:TRINITY_DN3190_c0_g1_i2.p1 TRINITY_DN3190_c0_g1~~TRINITY_DN3190_c0_g1_i2.p1  ORF type:complete len:396 (-),score=62.20 TRINITY_DN3190_c0_g1_i2:33-1220(-)